MCYGCWEEFGCPQINNPKVWKAVEYITKVYDISIVAGPLHVQIDDWNIEDEFWKESSYYEGYWEGVTHTEEDKKACREAFEFLGNLTLEERASALALYDSYWEKKCSTTDDQR